jgi:hypothetical protein
VVAAVWGSLGPCALSRSDPIEKHLLNHQIRSVAVRSLARASHFPLAELCCLKQQTNWSGAHSFARLCSIPLLCFLVARADRTPFPGHGPKGASLLLFSRRRPMARNCALRRKLSHAAPPAACRDIVRIHQGDENIRRKARTKGKITNLYCQHKYVFNNYSLKFSEINWLLSCN